MGQHVEIIAIYIGNTDIIAHKNNCSTVLFLDLETGLKALRMLFLLLLFFLVLLSDFQSPKALSFLGRSL